MPWTPPSPSQRVQRWSSAITPPQAVTSCFDLLIGALHSSWKVSFCYMFAYFFCFSLINYNYMLFHLCLYISLIWLQSASPNVTAPDRAVISKGFVFFLLLYCFLLLSHNLSSKWFYSISELFLKLDGVIPDVFMTWKDFQWVLGSHHSLGGITWEKMMLCMSFASICSSFRFNPGILLIEEGL